MEKPCVVENARERARLAALVERLTDKELRLALKAGWTIAAVLAHLAFWEQWSLVRLRRWKLSGVAASPVDLDTVNDTFLPFGRALEPRVAAKMAVSSAEAIDGELEEIPDEMIRAIEDLGDRFRLYRAIH